MWIASSFTPQSPREMSTELKIVTLNCWGVFTPMCCEKRHERLAAIAEHLSTGEHDVVCLQEIWTDADFEKIRKVMAKSYPYSHYFHSSNLIGSGCCVFSKHKVVGTFFHRFPVNGFPQRVYHGDWFGGKGVGLARIRFHQYDVNVYCTHLHAQYVADDAADEYRSHRTSQAYELARFVRLTAAGADALVLCGDLNLHPDSLGLRTVTAFGGLRDAWACQVTPPEDEYDGATCSRPGNSFTTEKDRSKFPRGERLDYVLYAANAGTDMSCSSCALALGKIEGRDYNFSDHEGLSAVMVLRRAVTALGDAPDPAACQALKTELREEMHSALDRIYRDRFFYLAMSLLATALIWFFSGCCLSVVVVPLLSMYLIFALWSLIVVKEAERRAMQAVLDQLPFDYVEDKMAPAAADAASK